MKINPRMLKVNAAHRKLGLTIIEMIEEYDLTLIELQSILISELAGYNKQLLRCERHPDEPDKGADIL